jgi:uncharacterized membrane protein (DUF4010 family)
MAPEYLILRLGLALAIGLLVGLERGWRERDMPAGSRAAGIRTYGLSGLLGGVLAAASLVLESGLVFAFGFIGFAGVFAWFSWREEQRKETFSVTGVVAGLAVYGLGGLAVAGDHRAAAAAGVGLAGVLASREALHGLLKRMSWVELRSALFLAGMTAIGLSLLPNRTIDPWGGVNPWEIWLFTVLTAAISFAGYVTMRVFGPGRGVLISGLAGALVSSTAVTVAFARRASAGGPVRPLTGAAVLAAMISVLRVLVLLTLVKQELALAVAAPLLAAAAVLGAVGGLMVARGADSAQTDAKLGNPFDLGPLLLFAGSFLVVAAASAALTQQFGSASVVFTSGISGIMNVDVASLTAARMAGDAVSVSVAALAVLTAIAVNTASKVVFAAAAGPLGYALPLLGASALATAAGAVVFVLASGWPVMP